MPDKEKLCVAYKSSIKVRFFWEKGGRLEFSQTLWDATIRTRNKDMAKKMLKASFSFYEIL